MFGKLRGISVNGYRPFNGLNIFLSIVCILACITIYGGMGYSWEMSSTIALLVAIGCFALILYRNRKCKSIPKMIGFSVLSLAFSFLAVIMILFAAIGAGMSVMNGGGIGELGSTFSKIFGSGDGNQNNSGQEESSGSNWTKQYSHSKGEYSTDGQGHFRDQYGNEVYNPQGVTDYDKL